MLITILAFIAVLAIVVLAHEIGHFVTAKMAGVKVEEFGIGYPPRIYGKKRGETTYSINWLPVGGFVKMSGEEDPKKERSLASKGYGTRLLVLSSGSIMNALLPFLLISIALMIPHDAVIGSVKVNEVAPDSPAEAAGMLPDDLILEVDGREINSNIDVSRSIQLNLGNETVFLIEHTDGTTEEVLLTPRWKPPEGEGAAGISVETIDYEIVKESQPFWEAIPNGIGQTFEALVLFKNAILQLFTGSVEFDIAGPVGIAQISGEFAKAGISPFLEFTAFFSINLAILNILPLPALDGGRIAFVLVEWARRGKRISPKREGMVHAIGFMLLMAFLLAVTFQDILRITGGNG